MSDSLQPALFPEFFEGQELLTVEEDAKRGCFTGEIIEKNREKVRQIVRAIAEGIALHRIAKAYSVSIHTVLGIRDRHPDLIAHEKRQLSGQIGRILRLSADRYEEALVSGAIPPAQIPVAFGIFSDKKAALDGDATVRIEHISRKSVDADQVAAALESLKRASITVEPAGQLESPKDEPIDSESTVIPPK